MHDVLVIGRLRAGATFQKAQAEMETISRRLEQQYPALNTGHSANLVPLSEQISGPVRPPLLVLFRAVTLVLLIECANVANMALARATVRQREIAIRQALGVSPGQLIRLLLTESLLVSASGAALGLLCARAGLGVLGGVLPPRIGPVILPPVEQLALDTRVLFFTAVVSVAAGVASGLAPALRVSHADAQAGIRAGRSGTVTIEARRLRSVLVVGEIALACMLLIGATLLTASFQRLLRVYPGFESSHRLSAEISLPAARYPEKPQRLAFYNRLLERVSTLPAVTAVVLTSHMTFDYGGPRYGFRIEGRPRPQTTQEFPKAYYRSVSEGFFSTMGIPLLRGRGFTRFDRVDSAPVVLISQTTARRYWPNDDPIGKRLALGEQSRWRTIVGVTSDTKFFGLQHDPEPEFYFPLSQEPELEMNLVLRSSADPLLLARALRNEMGALDPDLPVGGLRTIDQIVAESVSPQRFNSVLMGATASIAFLLATVGLYGVMSYVVTQRTQEIGVRMSLGATPRDVRAMILGQGLRLTFAGVAIGVTGSLALSRVLSRFLYGVRPSNLVTLIGVSLVLTLVALAACYLPARRATQVDPLVALRFE